eukprot:UN15741
MSVHVVNNNLRHATNSELLCEAFCMPLQASHYLMM